MATTVPTPSSRWQRWSIAASAVLVVAMVIPCLLKRHIETHNAEPIHC